MKNIRTRKHNTSLEIFSERAKNKMTGTIGMIYHDTMKKVSKTEENKKEKAAKEKWSETLKKLK